MAALDRMLSALAWAGGSIQASALLGDFAFRTGPASAPARLRCCRNVQRARLLRARIQQALPPGWTCGVPSLLNRRSSLWFRWVVAIQLDHIGHGPPHCRLGGLLALCQLGIERPVDHARVGCLRVAQLPGLVDRLPGQAKVRDGGPIIVPGRNNGPAVAAWGLHLFPLLRGITTN